jgi:hypothetical protein
MSLSLCPLHAKPISLSLFAYPTIFRSCERNFCESCSSCRAGLEEWIEYCSDVCELSICIFWICNFIITHLIKNISLFRDWFRWIGIWPVAGGSGSSTLLQLRRSPPAQSSIQRDWPLWGFIKWDSASVIYCFQIFVLLRLFILQLVVLYNLSVPHWHFNLQILCKNIWYSRFRCSFVINYLHHNCAPRMCHHSALANLYLTNTVVLTHSDYKQLYCTRYLAPTLCHGFLPLSFHYFRQDTGQHLTELTSVNTNAEFYSLFL